MDDIVKKLEEAPSSVPQPGGAGSATEIRVRVTAESIGGQRKRAAAWTETASGARRSSQWQLHCDEGKAIGGDDTAPPPLMYFSAGIAF